MQKYVMELVFLTLPLFQLHSAYPNEQNLLCTIVPTQVDRNAR